uniref:Uncharacterized protein n=1 Tax=Anguilla anguilla TaxID=7936 RepID=A0A0E9PLG1_ANGAN
MLDRIMFKNKKMTDVHILLFDELNEVRKLLTAVF